MIFNENQVRQAIELIHGEELYELRYVVGKKVYSGYFKGADKLIQELKLLPESGGNVYITIQDVQRHCYNREQHERILFGKSTTSDDDIDGYKHLLIDLDPTRPSETSSTDEQLETAHQKAGIVYAYLKREGFPEPIVGMSGNGYHLLYKISLDNTKENTELIKQCLKALHMMFSDDFVKIDTSVSNPARVSKLYGTQACKGANTPEAPHRISEIKRFSTNPEIVPIEKLRELAANAPCTETARKTVTGDTVRMPDLDTWLTEHSVPVREVVTTGGVKKYILDHCPFNPEHKNKDAAVFQLSDGSYGFKCFHNSCSDKHWKDFRLYYEPDAFDKGQPDVSLKPNHLSAGYRPDGIETAFEDKQSTFEASSPVFYTLQDVLNFPEQPEEYIQTGIGLIDSSLGGMKKGLVTCVSGLRGSGKSSLLSQIVLYAGAKAGARVAMFSGELTARTASDWLFRQAAGDRVQRQNKFETKTFVTDDIKQTIADSLSDKIYIYNNDYGNRYEVVIPKMIEAVKKYNVDLILLDNLMSLDINCLDNRDKYKAQSLFVERLETFAKRANIHIIFVAHPRKAQGFLRLDDISGSGDIANRVDNAIIVHRSNEDFKRKSQEMFRWKDDNPLYAADNVVEICKDRENGTQDKFIPLWFDPKSKRFSNYKGEKPIDYI